MKKMPLHKIKKHIKLLKITNANSKNIVNYDHERKNSLTKFGFQNIHMVVIPYIVRHNML